LKNPEETERERKKTKNEHFTLNKKSNNAIYNKNGILNKINNKKKTIENRRDIFFPPFFISWFDYIINFINRALLRLYGLMGLRIDII
jgi:hypothetical protein